MLISISAFGIITFALIFANDRNHNENDDSTANGHVTYESCNGIDKQDIWEHLPECLPRKVLVPLPYPSDPDIIQFIPNEVEVLRCAGTCYDSGKLFRRCVATQTNQTKVPVLFEKFAKQGTEEVCGYIEVESHSACGCGCENVKCTDKQELQKETCSCVCKDEGARKQCLVQSNKIWDVDRCLCRCRDDQWKECATGYFYEGTYTCQCNPGPLSGTTQVAKSGLTVFLAVLAVVLLVFAAGMAFMWNRTRKKLLKTEYELKKVKEENIPLTEIRNGTAGAR